MRGWRTIPALQGYRVAMMYPKKPAPRLTIAMSRQGCTNRPFFTMEARNNLLALSEPGLEQIGSWDPLVNIRGEQLVGINLDRLIHWMGHGAAPSLAVSQVLGLCGVLPMHPSSELEALRMRRRLAAEKAGGAGSGGGGGKSA